MLDATILPIQNRLLQRPAAWLAARGVGADLLSLIGLLTGFAACWLIAERHFFVGLLAILANRALDGLDGAVARQIGPTDRGAFIDIAFDFFFYALVPAGFALADPSANALPAALLLMAFIGTGSSFLAFSALAAKRGLAAAAFPTKGIYYLGGLTEGAETVAVFMLMCLWPAGFPLIAALFAGFCLITTLMRWWWGWRLFSKEPG